jgi:hypothetical protein
MNDSLDTGAIELLRCDAQFGFGGGDVAGGNRLPDFAYLGLDGGLCSPILGTAF